jgi:peptidoglycan/LPS O-acetylase OafA/YrhL
MKKPKALAWLSLTPKPITSATSSFVLDGADGVRALACLLVVFHHLMQRLGQPEQAQPVQIVQTFFLNGGFGVSAFFVLSGMLLSYPFWKRYLEGSNLPNLLEYVRRRFVRIAPGFYASLIVTFLLALVYDPDVPHKWIRLLSGLTFTSSFHHMTFFPVDLNGPLWSISFEVFCYVLMPVFMIGLFALARVTSSRTVQTGSMRLAVGYWIGVFVLTVLAHFWIMQNLTPDSFERGWQYGLLGGAKYWMPNYNPVGFFGHYCIGVLAAGFIAWRQRRVAQGIPARTRVFDGIVITSSLAAIAFIYITAYAGEFSFSLGRQPYGFPAFPISVALILAAAPFATWVQRPLDNTFFRYTAKVSFGLYIWHYPILELTRIWYNPDYRYFGISSLGYWALLSTAILIVSYVVAALSYRFIETPFLKEPTRVQTRVSP